MKLGVRKKCSDISVTFSVLKKKKKKKNQCCAVCVRRMIYLDGEIIVFALNVCREAARECRRKKKEYIKCLENRVAVLENRNQTLIDELKSLKELYQQKTD